MKTIKNICLFSVFSIVLTSFYSQTSTTPFEKALGEKKIEIKIQSTGNFLGNCINIEVKNLTKEKLNLEMIPGTIFVPEDEKEQTLITTRGEMLALNRNETKLFKVYAYCTEASDRCPSEDSKFTVSKSQNGSLIKLIAVIDSLKTLDDQIIQQSIWCLTDSESVSNVYNDDMNVSRALRKYLCSVTGQKDTWYNTAREITVDRDNNIVSTAKEIKGEIAFESTEPVELQGSVVDSLGNVLVKNPNKMSCPAGKIKFEFTLKVAGWKPGNYAVVYTNNGKEVIHQAFSF